MMTGEELLQRIKADSSEMINIMRDFICRNYFKSEECFNYWMMDQDVFWDWYEPYFMNKTEMDAFTGSGEIDSSEIQTFEMECFKEAFKLEGVKPSFDIEEAWGNLC